MTAAVSLSGDVLREIEAEARRQQRSRSWIVQQAWRIARERIRSIPGPPPIAQEKRP